jgi:hypothetical protein
MAPWQLDASAATQGTTRVATEPVSMHAAIGADVPDATAVSVSGVNTTVIAFSTPDTVRYVLCVCVCVCVYGGETNVCCGRA